jgi:branched-chain amino acid transport system substrate-binding protein
MRLRSRTATALTTAALLALGTIAVGSSVAGAQSDDTVRIGLKGPLTGDQSSTGQGMLKGAKLAAKQLNADGGIGGKKVEIVAIDDEADPDAGVTAANEAIAEGLDGVVGPYNSGVGAKTLPLYIAAGLVPIRLTSADETAGLGFTLQPMTSQIAPAAAMALTEWQQATSVAIVYDNTTLYTQSVSASLKTLLEQAGVTVTAYEPIEPGAKSYTDVVEKLAATNPDVIYAATYYPEGGLIAKEMRSLDVDAQCIADYGAYDNGFIPAAGIKAAQQCPVVGVPAPNEFAGSKKFVKAYKLQFDEAPGTWSPYAFDSVKVLAAAAEEAGGFDAAALTGVLNQVNGEEGWTGSIALQAGTGNREPATVVLLATTSKGTFKIDTGWADAVGETP